MVHPTDRPALGYSKKERGQQSLILAWVLFNVASCASLFIFRPHSSSASRPSLVSLSPSRLIPHRQHPHHGTGPPGSLPARAADWYRPPHPPFLSLALESLIGPSADLSSLHAIAAIAAMLNLNQKPEPSSQADQVIPMASDAEWKVLIFDNFGRDVISSVLRVNDLRENGVTVHM